MPAFLPFTHPPNPLTQATIHPFPPSNQPTIHSTNHLSIHLTIQPTIHSNHHPSIHPSNQTSTEPTIHLYPTNHPSTHRSILHPLTHPLIYSSIFSFTHPPTHSLIHHQSSVHPSSIRHPSIHPSPIHPSTHLVIPHPSATSRPGIPCTLFTPTLLPFSEDGAVARLCTSCQGRGDRPESGPVLSWRTDAAGAGWMGQRQGSLQPVAQVTGVWLPLLWLLPASWRKTRSARHWPEVGTQHGHLPKASGCQRSLGDTRGTGVLIFSVAWCPLTAYAHTSGPAVSRRVTHRCPRAGGDGSFGQDV